MKRKTPLEHVVRAETNQRHEVAHMMENFETELKKRKGMQNTKAESQAEECSLYERAASVLSKDRGDVSQPDAEQHAQGGPPT